MPADILPQCPVVRVMTITSSGEVAQAVRHALDPGQFHCRTGQWRHGDACGGRAWCPHLAVMDMEWAGAALQHPRPHGRLPEQHLPVLVLVSQPGDPRARLAPFAWGADDVLSLPFVPEELAARIRAIVRRTYFCLRAPSCRCGWVSSRSTCSITGC